MINTKELMRGNLVQSVYVASQLIQVHAIYIAGIRDQNRISYMSEELTGIPLTEQWLERMGFEKDLNIFSMELENGFDKIITSKLKLQTEYDFDGLQADVIIYCYDSYEDKSWNFILSPSIKYVHQLQNLYYALTGKELTATIAP